MRGRKPAIIELSALERQGLEKLIKGHNTRQQIALRSQIILAAAEGKNNSQISIEFQLYITSTSSASILSFLSNDKEKSNDRSP